MAKETISVKSNGLRNELKEIRKSIDTLTITLQRQTETFDHIADTLTRLIISQTHKRHEKNNNCHRCGFRLDDCECNRSFQ